MDIIIFARYWEPGKVKTRLCPPLTCQEAAGVHRWCLDLLVHRLAGLPDLTTIIAYEPACARDAFRQRYPEVRLLPQHGDGLTAKLQHLLTACPTPCLITGSDCPSVPQDYYSQAVAALQQGAEVVLGPTADGGCYLLGLDRAHAAWFRDIPWSTDSVSAALRTRAREACWRIHELPPWYDVDTMDDLRRLQGDIKGVPITDLLK